MFTLSELDEATHSCLSISDRIFKGNDVKTLLKWSQPLYATMYICMHVYNIGNFRDTYGLQKVWSERICPHNCLPMHARQTSRCVTSVEGWHFGLLVLPCMSELGITILRTWKGY